MERYLDWVRVFRMVYNKGLMGKKRYRGIVTENRWAAAMKSSASKKGTKRKMSNTRRRYRIYNTYMLNSTLF